MSNEAEAIALNHSRATSAAKLVLLGIANHDGDGGSWPSVQRLAIYAGINIRNTQLAIRMLEQLGEIEVEQNAGGTQRTPDHTRPNLYKFKLTCPPNCDRTAGHNLLCVECGERLPFDRRPYGLHKKCEAERKRLGVLDPGESAPLSPATPGVVSDIPPVSPATPELPVNPPSTSLDLESHEVDASAREDAPKLDALEVPGIDFDPCPKFSSGNMPHAYGRDGVCVSCGKQAT